VARHFSVSGGLAQCAHKKVGKTVKHPLRLPFGF
jgi:hypothetical protein